MSGETEKDVSGWTVDTLRVHVERALAASAAAAIERDVRYEQRFIAQQAALTAALTSAKEAVAAALLSADRGVIKTETAADKRFESVNEFRQSLNDMTTTLLPRMEAEQRFRSIEQKIERLEKEAAVRIGSDTKSEATGRTMLAIVAIGVSVLLSLLGLGISFLMKR